MIKCAESGTDQYEALLEQRNTPRQDTNLSPSQMLFGRKTRTKIPSYHPEIPVSAQRNNRKNAVKRYYNKSSKQLPVLRNDQPVYFQHRQNQQWQKGKVIDSNDRNYIVKSENGGEYRRNRAHIRPTALEYRDRTVSPPRQQCSETQEDFQPVVSSPTESQSEQTEQTIDSNVSRPRRNTRQPAYLKDYVTN